MSEPMTIVSDWTRQIESGEKPSSLALKDHLEKEFVAQPPFLFNVFCECLNKNM